MPSPLATPRVAKAVHPAVGGRAHAARDMTCGHRKAQSDKK
jgi:hypothetical protein